MIIWLDHLIFGNGFGLISPSFDDAYFWIVNTWNDELGLSMGRSESRGELYKLTHAPNGLGLTSIQWSHPKCNERRELLGYRFKPFYSKRVYGRVLVDWEICNPNDSQKAFEKTINERKFNIE